MTAVTLAGKTALFVIFGAFSLGVQDPPATEKPTPVAPTIRLALARLKPDSTIEIGGDRVMASGDGGVWVASRDAGTVTKIDAKTNKPGEPIAVGKQPCAGLATGFGSLIVPFCGQPGLGRVDLKKNAVTVVMKEIAPGVVGPVTAVSSIWVVGGAKGMLSRIDPDANAAVAELPLGARALAIAFGQSALWVATENHELLKISPYTVVTQEIIKVGKSPRSIAIGEGSVWALNAGDGTISRVDPKTNKVTKTIALGAPLAGGQIAVGEGSVWVSAPGMPLARIDPRTNHVVQVFSGEGGGTILIASGSIWITATAKTIWRLDPKLVEATRQ
jgi:DNA-binding beta-propeller fold protein YncE